MIPQDAAAAINGKLRALFRVVLPGRCFSLSIAPKLSNGASLHNVTVDLTLSIIGSMTSTTATQSTTRACEAPPDDDAPREPAAEPTRQNFRGTHGCLPGGTV